jgi:hypothetical protein
MILAAKNDPLNPILRSGVKAVGFIGSGVIVARDFETGRRHGCFLLRS